MSGTIVIRNPSKGGESVAKASGTFTGDVYFDMLHMDDQIGVASVTFTPGARTLWHIHEEGQVLKVVGGSGWICDKDGVPQRLQAGDLVWTPPGTTHWHGADDGSIMTHLAVSIGKITWLDAVSEGEYSAKTGTGTSDQFAG